ncbi:MAG: hypothetical protein KTR31_19855 [Myxococcales bacterium]|nr:hypothetical protein [Myxococcales bacterium]
MATTADIDALFVAAFIDRDDEALAELESLCEEPQRRSYVWPRVLLSRAMRCADPRKAIALVDEGLAVVDPTDRIGHLRLLNFSGCLLLDVEDSIGALHPMLLATRLGRAHLREWTQATVNVAFALLEAGDLDGAERHARQIVERGGGAVNHARWVLHDVYVARRDPKAADEVAREARDRASEAVGLRERAVGAMLEAAEASRRGDVSHTLACVERAEQDFGSSRSSFEHQVLAVLRVEALAASGDAARALEVIEDTLGATAVRPLWKAKLCASAARILASSGQPDRACVWFEASLRHQEEHRHNRVRGLGSLVERMLASENETQLELVTANLSLSRALANLQRIREELEQRVASRTERLRQTVRQLEEEVAQRRLAEGAAMAASAAKSTFLATMSHELRTPLTAIRGLAEILGEEHADDPETVEDVGRILAVTRHLIGVIDEILDLARVESGGLEICSMPLALKPLVDEVAKAMAPLARAKGLRFVEPAVPDELWVSADPLRLRQVVLNLLGNAIEFTESGFVEVEVTVTSQRVCLAVRDSGPGIPHEARDRIFRAFEQVDNTRTRRHDGVGLGLAISRHLMQGMGGTLTLAHTEEGSCFQAELVRTAARGGRAVV